MPAPKFFTSDQDLDQIHNTSLRILAELGILVKHEDMCDRLVDFGCRAEAGRIYIPREVTKGVLRNIPASFQLFGRDPQNVVTVEPYGKTLFTNSGIVPNIIDFESGRIRRSTQQDVEVTTRLLDALPNEDIVYVSLVDATDASPHMVTLVDMAVTLANTTKPLVGPGVTNRLEAEAVVDLATAVRGDDVHENQRYPLCAPFICPISPLGFPAGIIDALIVIAKAKLPLTIITNPVMGTTAPYSIAGTVALGHAEIMAAAVMAHAVQPGLPILSCSTPSVADMRTLVSTTGGPETGLTRRTTVELARYLGLPSWTFGHSSSARLDLQMSDEKTLNALLITSARPAIIGGLGAMANVTLTSYDSLILDNERYGALRRVLDGVVVDEVHLGYDVLADHIAGNSIITHQHTIRRLRAGETWIPALARRRGLVDGKPEPGTSLERAHNEARRLMAEHRVPLLSDPIQARISDILNEFDRQTR